MLDFASIALRRFSGTSAISFSLIARYLQSVIALTRQINKLALPRLHEWSIDNEFNFGLTAQH